MSGTISRRCPTCSPTWSGRCARPSSATNRQPNGGLTFRQRLPLGSGLDGIGPCADGHFGAVIKTHRDWRICGDANWLRGVWPEVRRTLEYACLPENPDRWDPRPHGHPLGPPTSHA